jgi:phage shock protein C
METFMSAGITSEYRRFTRDADRAMVGGVCAGIAGYLGFNLCVTRILFVIFFFAAMPFALIAYLALVFLVPASSRNDEYVVERVVRRCRPRRKSRKERRHEAEEARRTAAEDVSRRARELEERLARIEKHVTSRRYQLDEEFRNL